jgi:hypothetical protein
MGPHPLAGIPNPFRDAVVSDPWQRARADVPEIQEKVFRMCGEALESVRARGRTTSVLLHGEPGSGKTHLLSRLRAAWVGADDAGSAPMPLGVVFIYVRLQTSPRRIWRHLRHCFADDLLRPYADGGTQLDRILLHRFAEGRQPDGDLALWWEWLKQEYAAADHWDRVLDELFGPLDRDGTLGWELTSVLGHLFLGRDRRMAQAWLRGEPLPEPTLARLELGPAAEEEDEQEDRARQVVAALCRLAGPGVPVVFCFDQIEALQVDPQDRDELSAFAQLVSALFHETSNALLISCIQSSYLDLLKGAADTAAWARLAAYQGALNPLRWDEAARLIRARMDSQPELARLRAGRGRSPWPLPEDRLKAMVGNQGMVARRLLSACAELYEAARGLGDHLGTAEEFLEQTWQELQEQALTASAAGRTDEILAHGLPLLVDVAARQWTMGKGRPPRDVNLVLEGPDGRVGVCLCNTENMTSLAGRFRRLRQVAAGGKPEKLVLLRDARLPISKGAKKAREYLDELKAQGVCELRPSTEVLAALQALRALLSEAKAGDLALRGEPLGPQTVREWLAAHLPRDLAELLDEVLSPPQFAGGEEPEDDLFDRLMELLEGRHVLAVEEAAAELEQPLAALEGCVRRNARHFGHLAGPPAVLFEFVPAGLEC